MKTELSIEHLYMQAGSHFVAGFEESNFAEEKFSANFVCRYKKAIEVEIYYTIKMQNGLPKTISLDVCTDYEDQPELIGNVRKAKEQALNWVNTFLNAFHCEIREGKWGNSFESFFNK